MTPIEKLIEDGKRQHDALCSRKREDMKQADKQIRLDKREMLDGFLGALRTCLGRELCVALKFRAQFFEDNSLSILTNINGVEIEIASFEYCTNCYTFYLRLADSSFDELGSLPVSVTINDDVADTTNFSRIVYLLLQDYKIHSEAVKAEELAFSKWSEIESRIQSYIKSALDAIEVSLLVDLVSSSSIPVRRVEGDRLTTLDGFAVTPVSFDSENPNSFIVVDTNLSDRRIHKKFARISIDGIKYVELSGLEEIYEYEPGKINRFPIPLPSDPDLLQLSGFNPDFVQLVYRQDGDRYSIDIKSSLGEQLDA